ncbi:ISAs1 family transposase [Streptomyces albogriseolus]|uniref:ISAs1 family transposase n=1 Tax=Streptomyces albogriseolus TaxID=1887 RepID=UPI00345FE6B8
MLAGARSLAAIGEWITDAPAGVLRTLGFVPDPLTGQLLVPHPATIRRVLKRLDGDAFDAAVGAFLHHRMVQSASPSPGRGVRRAIAVDGKTVRGSRTSAQAAVSLLAAMHHSGTVLAQRQVADKSNEIPAFAPLLDTIDLENTVVTADALHTQHQHGAYLRSRGAHYLAVVKRNHPGLYDRVRKLHWQEMPLEHYDRTRAHHRMEIRRLKAAALAYLDYPNVRQALQVVRWRRALSTGKLTIERVYLITSLRPGEASGDQLAACIRGHWAIDRDRTYREDESKIRTGQLPRTMATLRNLAISAFRQEGQASPHA